MVSATQQSSRIRKRKARRAGARRKRAAQAHGTPAFAIHPTGYNPNAADSPRPKAAAPSKATSAEKKK